ncbi:MAG: hypothetical protein JW827_04525 [Spirochaetes bacterium]|nr:hypothetical protein [Spirochaetota bacterium]
MEREPIKKTIIQNHQTRKEFFTHQKTWEKIRKQFFKDLKLDRFGADVIIIATGHQPLFYYPGIIFKNYYTHKIAGMAKGIPVNFIVDTDEAIVQIVIPGKNENIFFKKLMELKNPDKKAYFHFKPSQEEVKHFFIRIEKEIKGLDDTRTNKAFRDYFKSFLELFSNNHDFVETISFLRRQWEKSLQFPVLDIRISRLSDSIAFAQFIWELVKDIDRFTEIYNDAVQKVKKNEYQAVKYLTRENNTFELPFWYIGKSREEVFLKKEIDQLLIFTPLENLLTLSMKENDNVSIQKLKRIKLVPKAVTLTLILRLFFADLFIHGTGGQFYDRVTDEILMRFYHLNTLPFAMATGNIYLPLFEAMMTREKEYREKKDFLKELKYHPEKYLTEDKSKKYISERKALARLLSCQSDPVQRKSIHDKLTRLGEQATQSLKDRITDTKKEISRAENIIKFKDVFAERKYPYFLFPGSFPFIQYLDRGKLIV